MDKCCMGLQLFPGSLMKYCLVQKHSGFVKLPENYVYGIIELVTFAEALKVLVVFFCIFHFNPRVVTEVTFLVEQGTSGNPIL